MRLAGILAGLACILGHNFPVWLRFRGGKGVATTVGVILGLMPAAFAVAAVVWIVSFFTLRYVSLASLLAAAVLPVAVWFVTRTPARCSGFRWWRRCPDLRGGTAPTSAVCSTAPNPASTANPRP